MKKAVLFKIQQYDSEQHIKSIHLVKSLIFIHGSVKKHFNSNTRQ